MDRIAQDPYLVTALIVAGMVFVVAMTAILSPKIDVDVRRLSRLVVGYKVPPIVVSFVRRGLTALVTLLVTWLANLLGIAEGVDLVAVAGGVATAIETLGWGMFDQLKKSHQNDLPPSTEPVNLGSAYVDLRPGSPPGLDK